MDKYLPTGNETISIPTLSEQTAGIEDITFLHMASRGLIEIRGSEKLPLILPFVRADEQEIPLSGFLWERLAFWIPRFTVQAGPFSLEGTILPPTGERGFAYRMVLCNRDSQSHRADFGLTGCWDCAWHCVNENKPIDGSMHCYPSAWNNSLVFDLRCGTPLFAFAPMSDDPDCRSSFQPLAKDPADMHSQGYSYRLSHSAVLEPGESRETVIYWGFGFEEVAAATSAKEMLRQGYSWEEENTLRRLRQMALHIADPKLSEVYHTNLYFCLFFSTGITLDTEELVLVTSRSPRYYVSAAYWDRDSLFWSFPAILRADPRLARRMLAYVFGRQRRNIGIHSRYIDGTVLEPGFELDELMAPVIALGRYTEATGDRSLWEEDNVRRGLAEILDKLETRRHPDIRLYSTFLQPTDDEHVYPYLTYDNVLVWLAYRTLALFSDSESRRREFGEAAAQVKNAVYAHCVRTGAQGPYFAWSVDLKGNHDVYDEPPGSLQLLPYLGFCSPQEPVYENTVRQIRSAAYPYSFAGCPIAEIGCPHAPHPWLLSVANSLLCGRVEPSLAILKKAPMDNGIVCESIDENTGVCTTGEAFATCAGFVCHAIWWALEGKYEK